MKIIFNVKEKCCGCSACYNICPKQAIFMKPDEEGFLYPVIDEVLCVKCGKCTKVCPLITSGNYKRDFIPEFFVAQHKSENVLMESTSGGAFTAISDHILSEGGIIYGAHYDQEFNVIHGRAENVKQRNKMRVSKYVQSNLGDIFQQVKADLINGNIVLFTGTPCQIAGLRGFIGNFSLLKNLYLCDLICYGIPSPRVWDDYKNILEKEYGGKLVDVKFRSKIVEWNRENSNKSFMFKTSNSEAIYSDDRFYKLFFGEKTIMRPSCEACPYTDIHRVSDITIADYWGIEKYAPEWKDPKGVSLIMTNTKKGEELLIKCSDTLKYEKRPKEEALVEQQRLREPVKFAKNRKKFWKDYKKLGLDYLLKQLK
ncbi:MAG: Coenzyme F420 hydrogenase/dehydrogenase, beta subunit C-terminal domain [Clostridium cochlearium]|uniref:Coenzyme F420 hydrogenase/dehydrogenase, beta subunit C-terminal domain n=1 Tax=Clostridium cochlearium TaxID=1494 RepID=UPI00280B4E4B|nr:Coenzyme F420 hydrogenase/dehydrogenase, beta subunit C-terminal domain [Clostridium cochlearium]MDU1444058.1 Coenzyme F420 hydrogenase/dehydrogenase, beta subunit C-terminal domain [Clostridium cochlearium]